MSATLGGLIKDYRLQKNISQMEVAFSLGWNETSRLSRIEQGRVKNPSREMIDLLCQAIKLDEEEKNRLLLAGNYLPTNNEVQEARKVWGIIIHKWQYPAIIYDFSWRVIDMNKKALDVYIIPEKFVQRAKSEYLNRLEIIFDPDFMQNKYLKGTDLEIWHSFLTKLLFQFQYLQKSRTKEDWFINLIKRMMNNDLFKTIWQRVQFSQDDSIIQNYGRKKLVHPKDHTKRLDLHIFLEPLMKDPRFYMDLQLPANKETFEYFQ